MKHLIVYESYSMFKFQEFVPTVLSITNPSTLLSKIEQYWNNNFKYEGIVFNLTATLDDKRYNAPTVVLTKHLFSLFDAASSHRDKQLLGECIARVFFTFAEDVDTSFEAFKYPVLNTSIEYVTGHNIMDRCEWSIESKSGTIEGEFEY